MFTPSANRNRLHAPKKHVEREQRVAKTKSASVCVDGADLQFAGTVRDIHSSGARISIMNLESIENGFLLIVRSDNLVARCQVVWKKQNELGVRFLRIGDLSEEAQFRRDQQYAYKKDGDMRALQQQQSQLRSESDLVARQRVQAQRAAQMQIARLQIMGMDPTKPYSEDDLKTAYRRRAMTKHPDQGGDPAEFQQLTEVYNLMLQAFDNVRATNSASAA